MLPLELHEAGPYTTTKAQSAENSLPSGDRQLLLFVEVKKRILLGEEFA